MEKVGIISIANAGPCPYAAPIVIVPKKDSNWRMCVDYRGLNAHQSKMHKICHEVLRSLLDCMTRGIFFALDLLYGYYQIRVRFEDRHKTAFITH